MEVDDAFACKNCGYSMAWIDYVCPKCGEVLEWFKGCCPACRYPYHERY